MDQVPHPPADARDRDSLRRELETYRTYLLCVAWRLTSSDRRGDVGASDLVQRALLAALEKVESGNIPSSGEPQRLAWLTRIMKNLWLNGVRSPGAGVLGSSLAGSVTPPQAAAERGELQRLLVAALSRLDDADRQLVIWRFVDGVTCDEIARRRGYTASYASRACRIALNRLRSGLKEFGVDSAGISRT